jgi:hypothetical protein
MAVIGHTGLGAGFLEAVGIMTLLRIALIEPVRAKAMQ